MQEKRASVKDIAARLHISLSTVHKALTGKPGVSEARREQVLEVARELGYVVNTAAQSLARKDMTLGIILPSQWQEYFAELKDGMEDEISSLSEMRLRGEFYYINDKSTVDEVRDWIKRSGADLLLICSSSAKLKNTLLCATESLPVPVFRAGGGIDNPNSVCDVTIDAPLSGQLAADFLYCVKGADMKAAVFTGSLDTDIHSAKTDAFIRRTTELGGCVVSVCETDDNEALAHRKVCELFRQAPDTNCIYINTSTSKSVCRYIDENKLCGEVTVVGTDVYDELCENMKRGIMQATIYQNQRNVGRCAVRCAYEYLYSKNSYGSCDKEQERNILISPTLLLRANIEQR
ncbi:MAG: LacI family DNA-binding transcriptional regulator [Oscillospiraceae bacterium]|nr:LacI family DNA-binding transcriptional regulator [Oscillospiraceae bacterium]